MLSGPEVRNKVAEDMADAEIWEDRAYSFKEEIKPLPTAVVTSKGTVITIPPDRPDKGGGTAAAAASAAAKRLAGGGAPARPAPAVSGGS